MLLLHQTGDVRVGEVVRYKLTYTPSLDRILPPPTHLYVKIKNTSAIPLRAAYLHGPYTLYVSACPSTFDPNIRFTDFESEGEPSYEPQLKAGGSWTTKLTIPEDIRSSAEDHKPDDKGERKSFTWILEVASQVLFSRSAVVHFELLVGRDEKSIHSGLTGSIQIGSNHGMPGKLEDLQRKRTYPKATEQTKGIFSPKAVRLLIEDTESLWNTPEFPSWDGNKRGTEKEITELKDKNSTQNDAKSTQTRDRSQQKKIHLVILTHGLHSNLGADMLYMKESIDQAARQAKADAKRRKDELRMEKAKESNEFGRTAANLRSKSTPDINITPNDPGTGSSNNNDDGEEEEEEEDVMVRGFNGNAIKTERGIQYLGKRLAKYVLSITYPSQPYLPVKTSLSKTLTRSFTGQKMNEDPGRKPTHKHSTIVKDNQDDDHDLAYRIVSISFIGHSLGGLIQTYAIAYIQKHSPEFFDRIKPINFIALATPFLGLSNENPMYVKFALDFGLVGRTGQDLGLTWRAPTIARNSWGAMVNGLVNDPHKDKEPDPGSKPLLRILPTGPAHQALKKFRNRTVYSNVVNDGIVPLRTSCLLFLDWRGLERVEKARRENGLVGTMVNWGWNEVTGQNASTARRSIGWNDLFSDSGDNSGSSTEDLGSAVPQADASQDLDYDRRAGQADGYSVRRPLSNGSSDISHMKEDAREQESNAWTAFLSYFKPQAGAKPRRESQKPLKIYRRAQTMKMDGDDSASGDPATPEKTSPPQTPSSPARRAPVRGSSLYTNNSDGTENVEAPPKTSVFEAAGDLLNPPLPPKEFLLDPSARPRTIFHDRVYHPDDIPAPPVKRQRTFMRLGSRSNTQDLSIASPDQTDGDKSPVSKVESNDPGAMKIEEKIARAYHKDMSWRKVLVRLEPDAHNNLIVRRMFANAYGWPVVKHLVDTHFAFTASATTRDEDEPPHERAKAAHEAVGEEGEQVQGQMKPPKDGLLKSESEEEPRRHSADDQQDLRDRSIDPDELKHENIRGPLAKIKEQDRQLSRERSPSEAREARDEVSDLITMVTATGETSASYNSMHSGGNSSPHSATAALQRLQRKDSARWSDRYFEGTDDDDSDDDDDYTYAHELMQAKERGEVVPFYDSDSEEAKKSDKIGNISASTNSNIVINDGKAMVQEPGKMDQTESILAASGPIHELDPHSLNLTNVGLGTHPSDQVAGTKEERTSSGISEQVALAQGHKNDQG